MINFPVKNKKILRFLNSYVEYKIPVLRPEQFSISKIAMTLSFQKYCARLQAIQKTSN
jgi:hypothetical protein